MVVLLARMSLSNWSILLHNVSFVTGAATEGSSDDNGVGGDSTEISVGAPVTKATQIAEKLLL